LSYGRSIGVLLFAVLAFGSLAAAVSASTPGATITSGPSGPIAYLSEDTQAPQTTIDAGPSGPIAGAEATFLFSASEPASFECRLDSVAEEDWSPCASPQTYTGLAKGPHTFEVRATDQAGNTDPTPATASFSVDSQAPETTITSGPAATIYSASATFAFVASEPASFECRLDSADWSPCAPPQTYTALADGPHSFEVRATDQIGNTDPTPAGFTFNVYTGPPSPIAGVSFNVEPAGGNVELQCPGEDSYSKLRSFKQIPLGCLINTRRGTVSLTASKGSSGDLQSGHFWGGVFVVSQEMGDNQDVVMELAGRRMCERKRSSRKRVRVLRRNRHGGRRLWGSGKGNFKTAGSHGAATVRGTTWLVIDRCDSSTLFKVGEGTVWVRDFVKGKSVTLGTGQTYLAKAPIPRLRLRR
jgi:hypothetical protein